MSAHSGPGMFLGHAPAYWLELQRRIETEQGLDAVKLLKEVVSLQGKLKFCETRIKEMLKAIES